MSVPVKPGLKLYIHTNKIFKSEFLAARFTLEGNFIDVPVVFKNEFKVGVEVPDLGDIPAA